MLKVCLRFFRKKTPLFEASHRYTLPKIHSISGSSFKSERLNDPDKLKKLQSLVKDHVYNPGLSLSESVKKLAKTDEEFNQFLKNFKKTDEPEWSSILDAPDPVKLKSYLKDPKRKTQDRLDELHMHDQLKKKLAAEQLNEAYTFKKDSPEYGKDFIDEDANPKPIMSIKTKKDMKYRHIGEKVFINKQNFTIMFIEASSTTNITKLSRVNTRKVLLYMGNTDGIVSYGKGKGASYQQAYDDAIDQCKRNIICINLDHFHTVTGFTTAHYNGTILKLYSAKDNDVWGHPMYYNILALAGLHNLRFKIYSRNVNKYALIYCFFQCLVNNETPRMLAQKTGEKIYQMTFGRGLRKDYKTTDFDI